MTHIPVILRKSTRKRIVKLPSSQNNGSGMSLGIAIKGPEGIVLAADSRVTLATQKQTPGGVIIQRDFHFDNSRKLLHFSAEAKEHLHVGAVTYGTAIIPGTLRTAHSYIHELEKQFVGKARQTIEAYAKGLSNFYCDLWTKRAPPDFDGEDMVFIVGGYDKGADYGKIFVVSVPSKPEPEPRNPGDDSFGMTWGGQLRVASRIIHGIDPEMLVFLADEFNLDKPAVEALYQEIKSLFEYRIPYQVLPLQDCVDLAILLIRTTAGVQARAAMPRGVGGMVDVATITRTETLHFVQQKKLRGENRGNQAGV